MTHFSNHMQTVKRLFTVVLVCVILMIFYMFQDKYISEINTKKDAAQMIYRNFNLSGATEEGGGYYNIRNNKKLNFHCGHCAVVTNSGQMTNSGAGSAIDDTECIFRMNTAPTIGFEKDVGSRTTVRIVGHSNVGKIEELSKYSTVPNFFLISWLYLETDIKKNKFYKETQQLVRNYENSDFYLFTNEQLNISEQIFKEETGITRKNSQIWLSTGWNTLVFAFDVCDRVDVYGVIPESYCELNNWPNSTMYHYWENIFKNECAYYNKSEDRLLGGHKFLTEKAVFARWTKKHDLHFVNPTWSPEDLKVNYTELDSPYLRHYHEAVENGEMKRALLKRRKKPKPKTKKRGKRTRKRSIKQRILVFCFFIGITLLGTSILVCIVNWRYT